ncbi:hypothetical protein [Aestuariivirga litoralis]|uniref:hypothetical protein n=1 Tax=Aestuariivirga litoralis TaxID=2650924 RepID=UPI0032B268EC
MKYTLIQKPKLFRGRFGLTKRRTRIEIGGSKQSKKLILNPSGFQILNDGWYNSCRPDDATAL